MSLINLKTLKETRKFYNWKLKDEGLTGKQRDSFLLALKIVEKIIKGKEKSDKEKDEYFNKVGGY